MPEIGEEFDLQSEKMDEGSAKMKESIKKTIKIIQKLVKSVGKAVKHIVQWICGAISCAGVYILIGIIIIAIALFVAGFVMYIFSGGYDPTGGLVSSFGGVRGDSFYGTRFLYYDEEETTKDLKDVYLDFTYEILSSVNKTHKINIDYTKDYNNNTQIETFTLSFAKAISSGNTLVECVKNINHYGFDDINKNADNKTEKDIVLDTLANTLKTGGYVDDTVTKDMLLLELKSSYDAEFAYMKNVCAKVLVKDYILENEDAFTSNIKKENYFGFVYMPKEDVIIESTSFIFIVDENKTIDIVANYNDGTEITQLVEKTADSTWFVNGMADKSFDCILEDYIIKSFTAIDVSDVDYLNTEKTLFQIMRDGKFNIYFNDDTNALNANDLLQNMRTGNNYFYIEMKSDESFNMAESIVEYKDLDD